MATVRSVSRLEPMLGCNIWDAARSIAYRNRYDLKVVEGINGSKFSIVVVDKGPWPMRYRAPLMMLLEALHRDESSTYLISPGQTYYGISLNDATTERTLKTGARKALTLIEQQIFYTLSALQFNEMP